jgi:hypothetical protein
VKGKRLLNLVRTDLLPTPVDEFLEAAGDEQIALVVQS